MACCGATDQHRPPLKHLLWCFVTCGEVDEIGETEFASLRFSKFSYKNCEPIKIKESLG